MLKWKLALQNVIFFIVLYFLWFKKKKFADWSEKDKKHLEQELSDVLIYLVRLSEKCHIDLPKAAIEKIALNGKKYPAEKVQGSSKKYTEYNWRVANFWKRLQTFQRLRDASDEIVVMVTKPRILWEQSCFFMAHVFMLGLTQCESEMAVERVDILTMGIGCLNWYLLTRLYITYYKVLWTKGSMSIRMYCLVFY